MIDLLGGRPLTDTAATALSIENDNDLLYTLATVQWTSFRFKGNH